MKAEYALFYLSGALSAGAAPTKREVGGILMCVGANATGECHYQTWSMDECHLLPEPFYRNINTFAVDGDDFACFPRVYDCGQICRSPTGCTFGQVDFGYEHKYNLSAIQWDTIFSSFDCFVKRDSEAAS